MCPRTCFVRCLLYFNVLLQTLHWKVFFLQCVTFCASADLQLQQNWSHIGYNWMAFLQCVRSSCGFSTDHLWYLKSHSMDICEAFLHSESFYVCSQNSYQRMNSCIEHTCAASPHNDWACVSSNLRPKWMSSCIVHICMVSPLNELRYVSSYHWPEWMSSCIVHTCAVSPGNVWPGAFSNVQMYWMTCCSVHTCTISPQCESTCGF